MSEFYTLSIAMTEYSKFTMQHTRVEKCVAATAVTANRQLRWFANSAEIRMHLSYNSHRTIKGICVNNARWIGTVIRFENTRVNLTNDFHRNHRIFKNNVNFAFNQVHFKMRLQLRA
jgi:hypothetical protein